MDRRDSTNQHGYKVPTETSALYNIGKEEKALAKARKVYGIFVRICNLVGIRLNKIELETDEIILTEEDLQNAR